MGSRRTRSALVAVALVAASLVSVGNATAAVAATDRVSVKAMLAKLPVRAERHRSTYSAAKFGPWLHHDSCADVASEVLQNESLTASLSDDGCRVTAGRWQSPWDRTKSLKLSTLTLAHAVQLQEAWVSGASAWSSTRRAAFLNDTSVQGHILPVSTKSAKARGNREPGQWLPSWKDGRCFYVNTWIATKFQWHLSVDQAEKRALKKLLATTCKGGTTSVSRPPKPDIASLGTDSIPAPVDSTPVPVPVSTPTAPAALSTFPTFESFSLSGTGSRTISLPAGATAGSVSLKTTSNFDRSFLATTTDASGQTVELLASAFGDYAGGVAYGLWGDRSAKSLKLTVTGSWTATIAPLASAAQLTAATGSGASSRVFVYSGGTRNVTFTYPGSSNFTVRQFTAPGAGNLLVNEIGKTSRTVTLGAGPSVVAVESSPPHDGTYDIWTTNGLP